MATGKPIGSFYVQLGLNTKDFQRNLKGAERDLKQAFGASAIRTSELLAASVAVVGASLLAVGAAAVSMAADLERSTVSFTRLLGSADAADKKLRSLQEFASKTPYTFTELISYEKRLLALGFQADKTREVLTTVGDTASGLGLDNEGMGRLIKAFGDIKTKAVLSTQEMKQFAEVGVGAYQILAKEILGSADKVSELDEMIQNRAISSEQAISGMFRGLSAQFGGMMQLQSETVSGMWSTVRDEGENVLRIIGKQITQSTELKAAMDSLRSAATQFRTTLESKGLAEAFSGVFGNIADLSVKTLYSSITNILIPALKQVGEFFLTAKLTAWGEAGRVAVVGVAGAITGVLIVAVQALNIALGLAIIPLIKIAAGVAAITVAVYGLARAFLYVSENGVASVAESVKQLLSNIGNSISAFVRDTTSKLWLAFGEIGSKALDAASLALNAIKAMSVDVMRQVWANVTGSGEQPLKASLDSVKAQYAAFFSQLPALPQPSEADPGKSGLAWFRYIKTLIPEIDKLKERVAAVPAALNVFTPGMPKAKTPAAIATGTGSSKTDTSKSDAERALEDVKRNSEQIQQAWLQQTSTREALLDAEFQKEFDTLEKSKAINKNYHTDLALLSETYSSKGRALLEADAAEKLNFLQQAQQADIAALEERDNLYYESFLKKQENAELEATLNADQRAGDLAAFIEHLDAKALAERASLEGRRQMIDVYDQLQADATRSQASYMAEAYRTIYSGLTESLTGIITGAKNAGDAFKELGMQIIQMIVKWTIQRKLAAIMAGTIEATTTAASVVMAGTVAAAWAPAAAMVAAATFGASTAAAAAGLTGLSTLSKGLSLPMLADGGIVSKPTILMAGEGGESEAIIPLSKLQGLTGGGGGVTLNVINQTGQPVSARSSQRMDGARTVVDLFLEGYSRNVSGIQDVVGGR